MNRGGRGIAQAMMVAVAFMTIFPLYFILINAFKTREEYLTNQFLPPSDPTLVNLREAFRDGQLLTWIGNSIVITVVSVLHDLSTALLADRLVLMQDGRVLANGSVDDPAIRQALVDVFAAAIRIVSFEGRWIVVPNSPV